MAKTATSKPAGVDAARAAYEKAKKANIAAHTNLGQDVDAQKKAAEARAAAKAAKLALRAAIAQKADR